MLGSVPALRFMLAGAFAFVALLAVGLGAVACGEDGDPIAVTAEGSRLVHTELRLPAGSVATIAFDNRDDIAHQLVMADLSDGHTLVVADSGLVEGPAVQRFTFTVPPAGRYALWCAVHPDTMVGQFIAE